MSVEELKNKVTDKAKEVANTEKKITPQKNMENLLIKMLPEIKKAVGSVMTPERMSRIALSTYNSNEAFWSCEPRSFLSSMMKSAQCGLEPNTVLQECYLIPYGNQVNFQIGYKGILTLCHRTEQFKSIYAREVYKNDKFEYQYGLEPKLIHVPADNPEGEPIYYYAVYKLKNGGEDFVVWSRDRIINHARKYSKTFTNPKGTWANHFDSMAKKTCIVDVLKYAPKSVELAKAIENDFKGEEDKVTDIDGIENIDLTIEADFEEVNK